ncbi:MAG: MFS transporter [Steroidobacteraceae bacterium]
MASPQPASACPQLTEAWAVVALLTLAYVVSFIDRQIVALLIRPIRAELGLGDFQMSWILGPAFALCFSLFGLPLGWLADRVRRTRLVAAGIAVWCVMTAACGLAASPLQLFLARMGVGLGEAVLAPCALSLISDLFPRDSLARPIGVYSMGVSMGSGLALIIVGQTVAWLEAGGHALFAPLGIHSPWRAAFLLVGLPGLILAPLLLAAREPARSDRLAAAAAGAGGGPALRHAGRYIVEHWRIYVPLFAGKMVVNLMAYAHYWMTPLFERTWGWAAADVGRIFGSVVLVAGLIGVNLGGWLCDRGYRSGQRAAALRAMWWSLAVIIPLHTAAPFAASGALALALFFPALLAAALASAAASTATMLVTPNEFRGQVAALSLLVAGGLGQMLGPTSVAFLTDFVFRDESALRYSLAIAVAFFSIIGLALLGWGLPHYRAGLEQLEGRLTATAR